MNIFAVALGFVESNRCYSIKSKRIGSDGLGTKETDFQQDCNTALYLNGA